MDKELSKGYLLRMGYCPKYISYSFDKKKNELIKLIEKKLKFPVVIKPINEGSKCKCIYLFQDILKN